MITLRWHVPLTLLWAALLVLAPANAYAGASADTRFGVEKFGEPAIRAFALHVADALEAREVNLAIVARAGRPRTELPKGVSYTHVAFVVFEAVKDGAGDIFHTYTIYNLYQDQQQLTRGYLQQDFLYDFVAGVAERDVAVVVPVAELQQRLIRVIRSPAYAALHNPSYNLVANPWVDRFDNCATHLLKVCLAAIYESDDRERLYRNARAHFQPTPVRLGFVRRLGSHFIDGVSHADRQGGRLQTATYDSLQTFLQTNGLVAEAFVIRLPQEDGAAPVQSAAAANEPLRG